MKKILLALFFISFIGRLQAQVVFCPPGAKWKYSHLWAFSQGQFTETCIYLRDSVTETGTAKLIRSRTFLQGCGHGEVPSSVVFTLIKQIGDTIFMRNLFTGHQWQLLYNFAAQPGDMWINSLGFAPDKSYYTTFIDSVKTVIINNTPLRRLYVTQNYNGANFNAIYIQNIGTITERIGCEFHLFPFLYLSYAQASGFNCEDGKMITPLCYSDANFNLTYFTGLDCNSVGIKTFLNNPYEITLFPNPVTDQLTVSTGYVEDKLQLHITDVSGRKIKELELESTKTEINLRGLAPGVYILNILKDKELLYSSKVVKQG